VVAADLHTMGADPAAALLAAVVARLDDGLPALRLTALTALAHLLSRRVLQGTPPSLCLSPAPMAQRGGAGEGPVARLAACMLDADATVRTAAALLVDRCARHRQTAAV
jgi:hypothetical protein